MQFSTIIAFFAAAALVTASPVSLQAREFSSGVVGSDHNENSNEGLNNGQSNLNKGTIKGDYTVSQAIHSCGNGQLNCCNTVDQGDQKAEGLVGIAAEVIGGLGMGCSPITAGLLQGVDEMCTQKTVCCTGPQMPTQYGLVNIACSPLDLNII